MKQRQFTLEDQLAFAELSGDFNPLHVDPLAARRLMFGQPVVHGVHTLLWALEAWCESVPGFFRPRAVRASFARPVVLNAPVTCRLLMQRPDRVEMEVLCGGTPSTRITVDLDTAASDADECESDATVPDALPNRKLPRVVLREELSGMSGSIEMCLDRARATKMFPNLRRCVSPAKLAVIVSTTRVVGVECPGLHSLFSSLDLELDRASAVRSTLEFEVSKFDPRFGLVHIQLRAPAARGTIKAFLRPAPVEQPSYRALQASVQPNQFAGQTALVIGGSRGLGEVASKLLAVGGASVLVTYFRGEEDARRIAAEIVAGGGKADVMRFDTLDRTSAAVSPVAGGWRPTHCYYFATPFIFSGVRGAYSAPLFEQFCAYYVSGFVAVVDRWRGAGVKNFFYPSTVALDELPPNMVEYTAAKAAGETACDLLQKSHPGIVIYKPRLPRAATDQTVSVVPVENMDPVALMLEYLCSFKRLADAASC